MRRQKLFLWVQIERNICSSRILDSFFNTDTGLLKMKQHATHYQRHPPGPYRALHSMGLPATAAKEAAGQPPYLQNLLLPIASTVALLRTAELADGPGGGQGRRSASTRRNPTGQKST